VPPGRSSVHGKVNQRACATRGKNLVLLLLIILPPKTTKLRVAIRTSFAAPSKNVSPLHMLL